VQRLDGVARGHGLRLGMWADMLALIPEAIAHLPPGIIAYDWYYYPFGRLPRIELRNFAEYDIAPALKARGIEYWGCPMNGSFRHEPLPVFGERIANIRDWWRRCGSVGAGGMLVTSWEPSRLALEMTTVVDAAAACLWLDPGVDDAPGMLSRGFARVFGRPGSEELARRALACDQAAFAGYARWEVNGRWDGCGARSGAAPYRAELALLTRLSRRAAELPPPFRASVRFRRYLAQRDVFVREAASVVLALRRRLARAGPADPRLSRGIRALAARAAEFARAVEEGRRAARDLWGPTRDRRVTGPNERIAARDGARLRALRRWIARCAANPGGVAAASPLLGRWQLTFDVILERPALQRIVVEQRAPDGSWNTVGARTAIEFRAAAARPRTSIRREFSVPVEGPRAALRIAVRGLGQVSVARVELSDGVTALTPRGWKAASRRTLGRPAPRRGFPDLDWTCNAGAVELEFRRRN
jgi:hypothetical protein